MIEVWSLGERSRKGKQERGGGEEEIFEGEFRRIYHASVKLKYVGNFFN